MYTLNKKYCFKIIIVIPVDLNKAYMHQNKFSNLKNAFLHVTVEDVGSIKFLFH